MFRDTRYYAHYLTIEPGQLLLLYTDGVTEANSPAGEEYGTQRLVRAARNGRHLSARALIDFIHDDMLEWTGGLGATDDITFFIIKAIAVEGPGAPADGKL
jgi:sigma-B regulation protein RsbU (phosphoserine phosphatase)